jgi:citronellol/citronellal dehydrogenase
VIKGAKVVLHPLEIVSVPSDQLGAKFGSLVDLAYTISKFGMSMVVLGMAEELRPAGIACNALWPRTTVATAAVRICLAAKA